MDEKDSVFDSLLDSAKDYGLTSIELVKLKAVDKAQDAISSMIPVAIFIIVIAWFLLFLSLGLSFWLGELLGKLYFGFFAVAGIYFLCGILIQFILHKPIKRLVGDIVVKHMLK